MGVKGLLQSLRSITRPVPLERFRGLTVAVDAMSWLHKGVYAGDVRTLAKHQWMDRLEEERRQEEIVDDRDNNGGNGNGSDGGNGNSSKISPSRKLDFDRHVATTVTATTNQGRNYTTSRGNNARNNSSYNDHTSRAKATEAASKCVAYAMRQAEKLTKEYGLTVILVIDGGSLPSKEQIDKGRRDDRKKAFQDAMSAEAKGDSRNARKLYARACSVTHEMRYELVQSCHRAGIAFVVAPYEADAQMAQLAHSGTVDLIITEDSDLLAYGCPRVLFKVDVAEGRGEEIQLMRDLAANDDLSFRNWTHDMFVYMCIINGCDYCEGVPGVGIKTAHKLVRMYRTPSKIFKALRAAGRMPSDFEESFWRAYRTFRHQTVYNQATERVEPLLPIDETAHGGVIISSSRPDWSYVGPMIDDETAKAIATGKLHPTKKIPWSAALSAAAAAHGDGGAASAENGDWHRRSQGVVGTDSRTDARQLVSSSNPSPKQASRQNAVNSKDLFKFFVRKPKEDSSNITSPSRPPLQEIFINGGGDDGESTNKMSGKAIAAAAANRGGSQPIPIHFNEYSSALVGTTFEPLSRRTKGPGGASRNISRAVQRLKANARAKVVKNRSRNRKDEAESGDGGEGGGGGRRSDMSRPPRSTIQSAPEGRIRNRSRSEADDRGGRHSDARGEALHNHERDSSRSPYSRSKPEQEVVGHGIQADASAPEYRYEYEPDRELLDYQTRDVPLTLNYDDHESSNQQSTMLAHGSNEVVGYDTNIGLNQGFDVGQQAAHGNGADIFDNSLDPYAQASSLHYGPRESLDVSVSSPQLKKQNLNMTPEFLCRDGTVENERYHSGEIRGSGIGGCGDGGGQGFLYPGSPYKETSMGLRDESYHAFESGTAGYVEERESGGGSALGGSGDKDYSYYQDDDRTYRHVHEGGGGNFEPLQKDAYEGGNYEPLQSGNDADGNYRGDFVLRDTQEDTTDNLHADISPKDVAEFLDPQYATSGGCAGGPTVDYQRPKTVSRGSNSSDGQDYSYNQGDAEFDSGPSWNDNAVSATYEDDYYRSGTNTDDGFCDYLDYGSRSTRPGVQRAASYEY